MDEADLLISMTYNELRALAQHYLKRERPGHTLQATALVHEAYMKLAAQKKTRFRNRQHFISIASLAMRRILTDHARGKAADKRGGDRQRITLTGVHEILARDEIDLIALDEALTDFAKIDERAAKVVELRFYAGLTIREAADLLGYSTTTIEDDWATARAWLRRALDAEPE